jgi:hypothetical protein
MRGTQHPTGSRVALDLRRGTCTFIAVQQFREPIMAKGQQKTTREKKKPKKESKDGVKSESSYKQNFKK